MDSPSVGCNHQHHHHHHHPPHHPHHQKHNHQQQQHNHHQQQQQHNHHHNNSHQNHHHQQQQVQQQQHESAKIDRLVVIDPDLAANEAFMLSLKNFNVPVQTQFDEVGNVEELRELDEKIHDDPPSTASSSTSSTATTTPTSDDGVLYISGHFEGPLFERLLAQKKPIISDLIIQSCIEEKT
ncbi:PREDICTED: probable serine/threonine-protein kinase DDB_G0280133, partial [Rhagoletis zephyria]|uniref:probable serine/threonine-protein kinase DDB_G0280133 n=1 Tax=Rhagoletis zephyria TaxID=28612 RepID=UPI00081153C1